MEVRKKEDGQTTDRAQFNMAVVEGAMLIGASHLIVFHIIGQDSKGLMKRERP